MKIVVEVRVSARQDLFNLLAERTPTEGDAALFAAEYLEEIERQLREYEGPPPGSRRLIRRGIEEWWWRFADGIWTLFRITDSSGWLFTTTRTITVFAFEPQGPPPQP